MENNTPKVSAYIICLNEEKRIEECLKSLTWCDEIIVVDSGSSDRTLEIVKRYTDKVFHRDWTDFIEQKKYALSLCKNEWVISLDADEVVSGELQSEIQRELSAVAQGVSGFYVNRVVHYLGRYWRTCGWYPEYRLRLTRRVKTQITGYLVHEKIEVEGETKTLKGDFFHYTFDSVSDQLKKIDYFSNLGARALFEKGKRASLLKILIFPVARFIKFFILKRAFLEGMVGVAAAYLEALSTLLKYLKLWELQQKKK